MNENHNEPNHSHVMSICRLCGNSNTMAVVKTLAEAQEYLRYLPAMLREKGNDPDEDAFLSTAKVTRLSDDVVTVDLENGKHDILTFTVVCDGPFKNCYTAWRMESAAMMIKQQLGNALNEMFSGGIPDMESHQHEPQPDKSTLNSLLSGIDFPDDFLGPQH